VTIEVREYATADRDAIMALAPRLSEGKAPWRDDAAWLSAVQGWVADAAAAAGQPDHVVYVAVADHRVVGVVHAAERTHFTGEVDAYVGELVTALGMERRGIARALMAAAEAWAAARGLANLTLETGAANETARAFYTALGYLAEDVRLTKRIQPASPDAGPVLSGEQRLHRKLAADLFNGTWTLLDKPDRTPDDDVLMIHMAHASAYHWLQAGAPENVARSHWQCARMYSVLGRPEPAVYHARLVLDVCERNHIGDMDLAFAYEALARAYAVAGDPAESARWLALARGASADIADDEDRELLLSDLATIPA
jgi:GNAT superfamily N-acetyltransferase